MTDTTAPSRTLLERVWLGQAQAALDNLAKPFDNTQAACNLRLLTTQLTTQQNISGNASPRTGSGLWAVLPS